MAMNSDKKNNTKEAVIVDIKRNFDENLNKYFIFSRSLFPLYREIYLKIPSLIPNPETEANNNTITKDKE